MAVPGWVLPGGGARCGRRPRRAAGPGGQFFLFWPRAETGIVVDPSLGIVEAHDIATAGKHNLLHTVPRLVAVTVHVSPSDTTGRDHHAILAHHPTALKSGAISG